MTTSRRAGDEEFRTAPVHSAGSANRWAILFLVAAGALISFVDRTSISGALAAKPFIHHFHLSNIDRGWISSAFFWSYAVFQVPMGWVVDRYGVKYPYALSFGAWCVASGVIGLMDTFGGLVIMRLIVGAAEAVVVPATYRWIRDNFRESESGAAIGVYTFGSKAGPALGAPLAAWLIITHDWRSMFFITGAAGLIWLLPWLCMVRNDFPSHQERSRGKSGPVVPWKEILSSPMMWGALIVAFCYNYFTFYSMTWMPAYLVEQRGLTLESSGLYTFFSFAGIAIVSLAAGWMTDRLIARGGNPVSVRKTFVVVGLLGASTVVFGAYARSLEVALFWNVFSLTFVGLATANILTLCRITLVPGPVVGIVTGIQQVGTSLAGIVAPILSGWLLQISGSYDLPMKAIFLFLLIGVVATAVFLRPEWAPRIPEEALPGC